MTEQLATLKSLIIGTDLDRYVANDAVLNFALFYAESEILKRRNAIVLENQYLSNQIEGAIWRLGRIGAEGYASTSENGVSVAWKDVPEWLLSVVPKLGIVK